MIRFILIVGFVAFVVNLVTTQGRLAMLEWRVSELEATRPNTHTEDAQ